jgi:hypothetical protein
LFEILKPAPVFFANRLLAYGNPAGASEARRSVYSKKSLCKQTHHATMRSHFHEATHHIVALKQSINEQRNKSNNI